MTVHVLDVVTELKELADTVVVLVVTLVLQVVVGTNGRPRSFFFFRRSSSHVTIHAFELLELLSV